MTARDAEKMRYRAYRKRAIECRDRGDVMIVTIDAHAAEVKATEVGAYVRGMGLGAESGTAAGGSMTYRVVNTDNYGRDYPDEKFEGPEYGTLEESEANAEELNYKYGGEGASRFYKVVEMPYELEPGFEP